MQQQPPPSIIVKIIEAPHDPTGLADVMLRALGLTGVLVLLAVMCGIVTAGVLYWMHRRSA